MFSLKKNNDQPEPQNAVTETQDAVEEIPRRLVRPRTDIHEEPDAIVLTMEVPGCDDKGVTITTEKGVLTVRATPRTTAPSGYQPVWCEREDRVFERSFSLTDTVSAGSASAKVKSGVLTVRIPKAEEARPRKIAVTAA